MDLNKKYQITCHKRIKKKENIVLCNLGWIQICKMYCVQEQK